MVQQQTECNESDGRDTQKATGARRDGPRSKQTEIRNACNQVQWLQSGLHNFLIKWRTSEDTWPQQRALREPLWPLVVH